MKTYPLPFNCEINTFPDGGGEFNGDLDPEEFSPQAEGVERLLLALACEGVDVSTPEFHRAVETVLEALAND